MKNQSVWTISNRLFLMGQKYFGLFLVSVLVMLVFTAADAWRIALFKELQDLNNKQILENTFKLFVLLSLVVFAFKFLKEYITNYVIQKLVADIRFMFAKKLLKLPLSFFYTRKQGDIVSRITNDVVSMEPGFTFVLKDVFFFSFEVIFAVGLIFYANPMLGAVTVILFPTCVLPILIISRGLQKAKKRSLEYLGEVTDQLVSIYGGIKVIRGFNMEEHELSGFKGKTAGFLRKVMTAVKKRALLVSLVELFLALAMSLLFLFVGYYNVTIADLLVFGFAVARLYTASKELTKSYSALLESVPASHRVFEILDQSEETKDVGEELGSIEDVEIKDLTFSYDGQSVLQGVSLKAKKGEIVAVVGRSGVGKSTLVDLITGFYNPVGGQILFNGRDSNVLSKTSIISHIAVVPQETFLFNTTIEENLRYARPDANENEVVEAAKSAGIHSFICTLDAGYETVVGERGAKLSGGEKQRISIARALIRRPSLLILDEPTSNLDGEAEKKIEGSLQEIAKSRDRITFIIAHRLSTIKNADRIYVLDQGRIAETGTHNELLAKNGVYSSLYSKHSESDSQRSEGRTAATGN